MVGKDKLKKISREALEFQRLARERMFEYILAAFGLVAGLAWNDAVKTLIETVFPVKASTIVPKFVYAILMTLIVVIVSNYLSRILNANNRS